MPMITHTRSLCSFFLLWLHHLRCLKNCNREAYAASMSLPAARSFDPNASTGFSIMCCSCFPNQCRQSVSTTTPFQHTHTHTLTHSHTLTLTHSHTHTCTLAHSHTHTCTLAHSRTQKHAHTRTHKGGARMEGRRELQEQKVLGSVEMLTADCNVTMAAKMQQRFPTEDICMMCLHVVVLFVLCCCVVQRQEAKTG